MELVEGQSPRELISGPGLRTQTTIDYAIQIAEGLATAHASGIVHRGPQTQQRYRYAQRDALRFSILDWQR